MIWFGNLNRILPERTPDAFGPAPEDERMLRALQWAAERAPYLSGDALVDALERSGWVDRATAARLLPTFRYFDPDRHFAEYLRRLSFRGGPAADEFRAGVCCILREVLGDGSVGAVGPEQGIRFRTGEREGIALAHPEVSFSIGGRTREAIEAAVEEMPDALVVIARNFDQTTAAHLTAMLHRTEVPGTLVTVNLLLGIRAVTLRYQPPRQRVLELLGSGRPLRSVDVAMLGNR